MKQSRAVGNRGHANRLLPQPHYFDKLLKYPLGPSTDRAHPPMPAAQAVPGMPIAPLPRLP